MKLKAGKYFDDQAITRTRILFENEIGTVSCLPRKARREINILNFLTKTKQLSIAYKLMKCVHKPTSEPTDDLRLVQS